MSRPIKLHHRFEYAGYRAITSTVGLLPIGMATGFGAGVSRLVGMRSAFRKRAERNLRYAMPELTDGERSAILTEMFDGLVRTVTEFRYLPDLIADKSRIEIVGAEHLEAAKATGKGAVLVSGHFGNWEAVRVAAARLGWPPALIYRAFNNQIFDADAQKLMAKINAPIFHKGRRGSLGLVRHVKQGGAALILSDQRYTGAPEVLFFGKPAETSLGAAEIAQSYGAALLPVRGERIGRSSRFRVVIEAPIPTEGRVATDIMADVNARLEAWIRAAPGQYFWMHNRWGKEALRAAGLQ